MFAWATNEAICGMRALKVFSLTDQMLSETARGRERWAWAWSRRVRALRTSTTRVVLDVEKDQVMARASPQVRTASP